MVRLIDYRIDGFREDYRLVTNILDPIQAPAIELARLYSERWTIAHFGIRWIMHDAALSEDISTAELSFVHTLRVVLPWFISFSPSGARLRG